MTHTNDSSSTTAPPERHLTVVGLVVIVVVYLVVIQGLGLLLHQLAHSDAPYGEFPDELSILYGVILPVGLSILFVLGVVAWLGWQRDVFVDRLPTRKWVWIVPAILLVTALVVTDYGNLADVGGPFVLTLALGALLVGVGEEMMFRGLGITAFRKNGFPEARVALWSSILFGAAHLSNIFLEGPGALMQVVIVSVSGFYFYLCRRVSGGLLVPIVCHAAWDFSLFSGQAGVDPDFYALAGLAMVTNIVLLIILVVRRHHIEPAPATT
jgi:membrane protease YdiL (CAAX protease family)